MGNTSAFYSLQKILAMNRIALLFGILVLVSCEPSTAPTEEKEIREVDIQGHRGARGHLPENSIPGFILALEMGAQTLEMDLVMSADSQLVVNHDHILDDELCLGPDGQEIADDEYYFTYQMTMDEIRGCDCGSKGNPRFEQQKAMAVSRPALWEVLEVTEHMRTQPDSTMPRYNIEIKFLDQRVGEFHPDAATFVGLVLDEIEQWKIQDRVTLQSFNANVMEEIHRQAPEIHTSWLMEGDAELDYQLNLLSFKPDVFSPYHGNLTKEKLDLAHSKGLKVIPWTVNEKDRMKELIDWGVDGIISDYPDRVVEVLETL